MAWWDTVKDIYKKADIAVKGYLPGGITPSEAREAAEEASRPTPEPTREPDRPPTIRLGARRGETREEFDVRKAAEAPTLGSYDVSTNTFTSATGEKQSMDIKDVPQGTEIRDKGEVISEGVSIPDNVTDWHDPRHPDYGSLQEQISRSWNYKLGDPRSLKTTVGLSAILVGLLTYGYGSGALGGGTKATMAKLTSQGVSHSTALKLVGYNTPKAVQLTTGILGKHFTTKALTFFGTWAGSVMLGRWGHAEAVEAFTFPSDKFYRPEAIRTGDWTLVDESNAAAEEMSDISIWKEIGLWSPISGIIGVSDKVEGVAAAQKIRVKFDDDQKNKQATGQTEADYWKQRQEEQAQEERDNIDYYNEKRKEMVEWEAEARADEREDDARFWRREKEKQRELERLDREAIAKFWLEYRIAAQKIADNSRPSNLNFGLL